MVRSESNAKAQEAITRDHGTAIRNLEVQVGQIAKHLSERSSGTFLADTVVPRTENASAITTRSGKVLVDAEKEVAERELEEEKEKKRRERKKKLKKREKKK